MARNSQGTIDPLDFTPVFEQQKIEGVKVTITVPTDPAAKDEKLSALALKNRLREAAAQLREAGLSAPQADAVLAPAAELLDDSSYWRLQSRGLVVFAAEGFFLATRVPIELRDTLYVGDRFDVVPLAPVLASDRKLYVLALSKNSVRLFDTTRNVIEQLALEGIPASFDEVVDELPEREVDVRAGTAGTQRAPSFQGTGGDIDRVLLEKYIHAVGKAVGARLGTARSQQLVLASVAEYLPMFKASCPYPAVFDGVIAGNSEHTQAEDLRSAAWQLVGSHETAQEAGEQDKARSIAHAGNGAFDLAEIAVAAEAGRVATLYLPRDDRRIGTADARALANRAIFGTLQGKGVLRTLGELDGDALAVFRY